MGDLQVLVHPRLLLRTAMVVAVAGDVTLDLWAPLLEAQGTDPLPEVRSGDTEAAVVAASPCNSPTTEEVIDHLAALVIDLPSGDGGVSS